MTLRNKYFVIKVKVIKINKIINGCKLSKN